MHVDGGELGVRSAVVPNSATLSTLSGDRAGASTPLASVTLMALAPPMRPSTAGCGRAASPSGRCAWAYMVSSVSSTLVASRSASAAASSAPAASSAWSASTSAIRRFASATRRSAAASPAGGSFSSEKRSTLGSAPAAT